MQVLFARTPRDLETPVELRFVDLFMILVTVLIFVTVLLSIVSAMVGGASSVAPPTIRTRVLAPARLGEPYEVALSATDGSGVYKWKATTPLPAGLKLSDDGILLGEAQSHGQFEFNVTVRDTKGQTATRQLELAVRTTVESIDPRPRGKPGLASTAWLLPDAFKGESYEATLGVDPETHVTRWRITSGALPTGLNWDANGHIGGVATAEPGGYRFRLVAEDATGEQLVEGDAAVVVSLKPPPRWQTFAAWIFQALVWAFVVWAYWRGFSFEGVSSIVRRRRRSASSYR